MSTTAPSRFIVDFATMVGDFLTRGCDPEGAPCGS